jgi:hypothetical protein
VTILLVLAAVAIAVWLLLVLIALLLTRARDLDPGSSASDLREEPPAVVNLLVHGWRVTPDAVPATLLDLAARDYVDLNQLGPANTVCRLRRTDASGLEPYERRVLEHVRGLAVDGVVPAAALSTGPAGASTRWWKAFVKEVVKDARVRGLSRDRWSGWVGRFFEAAAVAPAALVGLAVARTGGSGDSDPVSAGIGAGVVTWALLMAAFRKSRSERETPKGAEVARHWLGVRNYLGADEAFPDLPPASVAIWDRYLAYGAAMGLARAAVRVLPMGAEDDRWAWSSFGGRWRKVEVDYPNIAILWGRHPLVAFLFGLLGAVPAYGAARLLLAIRGGTGAGGGLGWLPAVLTLLVLAAGGLLLLALVQAGRALVDLGSRRSFQGLVLRMRAFNTSSERNRSVRYTVAVDDGKAARVKAWVVPAQVWQRVSQGDLVDATVGPRLGYVFELRRAGAAVDGGAGVEAGATAERSRRSGEAGGNVQAGRVPVRAAGTGLEGVPGLVAAMLGPAAPSRPGVVSSPGTVLGPGAAFGPGVALDPAALVTAADAGRALGEPVGPAEALLGGAPVGGVRACQYRARAADHASVQVLVASGPMARMLSGFNRHSAAPVPELGEHVVLRKNVIGVAKGDLMVSIHLRGPTGPTADAALRQLAAAAIDRLDSHPAATPAAADEGVAAGATGSGMAPTEGVAVVPAAAAEGKAVAEES